MDDNRKTPAFTFADCHIEGFESVANMPADTKLTRPVEGFINTRITGGGQGSIFLFRDARSVLETLGLPSSTPVLQLAQLLRELRGMADAPEAKKIAHFEASDVARWLTQRGLDAASFAANLLTIANSSQVVPIIDALQRGQ